jgi:hypothetical protein
VKRLSGCLRSVVLHTPSAVLYPVNDRAAPCVIELIRVSAGLALSQLLLPLLCSGIQYKMTKYGWIYMIQYKIRLHYCNTLSG